MPKQPSPGPLGEAPPSRRRFKLVSDLLGNFQDAESALPEATWAALMKNYERLPYKGEACEVLPNLGTLRGKVKSALTAYVDYATEREQWAAVETFEGGQDGLSGRWSSLISAAFQQHCVKPWQEKTGAVMLCVRDMLLFKHGCMMWDCPDDVYPRSADICSVIPAKGSPSDPCELDVLHLRRRMTAGELHRKASSRSAGAEGWDRQAVSRLLAGDLSLSSSELESVWLRFGNGSASSAELSRDIDLVFSFVREFDDDDGITAFCFPELSCLPPAPRGSRKDGAGDRADMTGFLMVKPRAAAEFGRLLRFLSTEPSRKFHEGRSFAELAYTMSKTYDMVMNRIIQAVEDNMRVYLKAASQEQFEKLKRMRHKQYTLMEPGVELVQQQVRRDVAPASQVLRQLVIDQNASLGSHTIGEVAANSQPKTARQSEIDLSESARIGGADLKMFNHAMTGIMSELYRRFVSQKAPPEKDSAEWRRFERFKQFLAKHDVPESAWAFENVSVSSVMSLGAGSPAARMQAAKITAEALAIPAASPGERLAQRDLIAAVQGIANVDAYIPRDDDFAVPEDSLIALENDAMSTPDAKPDNTPVHPQHLHFRHIPRHIQDAEASLVAAFKMLDALGQMPPQDAGIYIKVIIDASIGVDSKLAHAQAHMRLAARSNDPRKKQQLGLFAAKIGELNKAQDKLDKAVGQMQEARLKEQRPQDEHPDLAHKRAMNQLDEEHTARMLALDFQKAQAKGEQLRQNSAANTEHKQALETYKTIKGVRHDMIKTAAALKTERMKREAAKDNDS